MKTTKQLLTFFCLCLATIGSVSAQQGDASDSTLLPGANFSLEGALELFRKANTPEEFEKLLNASDNKVNNLDLNEDGTTDYIRVINRKEEGVQIFILQAVISDSENQDIAVIEIEKTGNETAVIEIVGDEDLYGEETIVEPSEDAVTIGNAVNPGNTGNTEPAFDGVPVHGPRIATGETTGGIVVNVWGWPSVRFIYAPGYRLWISPWTWGARPAWWRPWRPLAWSVYRPYRYQYRHKYVIVPVRRVARARVIYRPARVSSVTVRTRNQVSVNRYRATRTTRSATVNRNGNQYQATRKKTTVTGTRGHKVSRTRTTVRKKR
jgi:hypothetical protein